MFKKITFFINFEKDVNFIISSGIFYYSLRAAKAFSSYVSVFTQGICEIFLCSDFIVQAGVYGCIMSCRYLSDSPVESCDLKFQS